MKSNYAEREMAWRDEHAMGWCDGARPKNGNYIAKIINVFCAFCVRRQKFRSEKVEYVDEAVIRIGLRDAAGEPFRWETGGMKITSDPRAKIVQFLTKILGRPLRGRVDADGLLRMKGRMLRVIVKDGRVSDVMSF